MYFTNDDYTIFKEENSANKNTAMIEERKKLQNKMLKLHEMIYSDIVKLRLSCHENKNHITTKIEHSRFNGKINSWLLVRYGKTPEEIALYKEFDYGFTKHVNLDYLDRICEYLNCPLSDLMEHIPNQQKKTGEFIIVKEHGNRKKKNTLE